MFKILVIEDHTITRNNIVEFLEEENFRLFEANDGKSGLLLAQTKLPDLIICDVMLPKMNGFQVLASLRTNSHTASIPVIFLTARVKRQDFRQGMEMGADDYIFKPFLPNELLRAVLTQINKRQTLVKNYRATGKLVAPQSRSVTNYKPLIDTQRKLSLQDWFNYTLETYVKSPLQNSEVTSTSNQVKIAVFCFRLSNFKQTQEMLGYSQSELILDLANQRLTTCFGQRAVISRLDRGDFAVILPYLGEQNTAIEVANVAQSILSKSFSLEKRKLNFIPLVGIAFYPDHGNNIDLLLARATMAMNVAIQKQETGGGVDQPQFEHLGNVQLPRWEQDLSRALTREELSLHYQPQISLTNGEICGCEALLRWQHPQYGNISPQKFIPIAESTGLIQAMEKVVFTQACKQLKTWHQEGFRNLKLAINLSCFQFNQSNLLTLLNTRLGKVQCKPQDLAIELTEATLIREPQNTAQKINQLKSLGFQIVIDDFGIGYSSLSYLQQFPFDILKLDRRFIGNLFDNDWNQILVKKIINYVHNLGRKVIAEGVETQEQYNFLVHHQCDRVQGYFLSSPLCCNAFSQFLQNR